MGRAPSVELGLGKRVKLEVIIAKHEAQDKRQFQQARIGQEVEAGNK